MTLAAVWTGDNRLYAVADTRIARPAGVLTEHGPKILAINVSCKQPGPSGFYDREVYRSSIGFAYAGATLPALCTHALVNTLFQNLIAAAGTRPPRLAEFAGTIGRISERYISEIGQLSGYGALFESVVFGFCEDTNRFAAFTLKPQISQGPDPAITMNVVEQPLSADNVVVIGSQPERLQARITELRTGAHPVVVQDAPRRALRSLINEGADVTVGGAVQYGWVTRQGFELVADAVPRVPRLPGCDLASLVLGFDMSDFQPVGSYRVGIVARL